MMNQILIQCFYQLKPTFNKVCNTSFGYYNHSIILKTRIQNIRYTIMKQICQSVLCVAPHIKQALRNYQPVVALESTIISHGMPYPQNKDCAISIENQVKKFGAIPATVAVIDGQIKVGLNEQQIQRLAYQGTKVKKVSRRDLPVVLMDKSLGATTVSSTMIGAQMAGIDVFVTGGIGGVHRGYQHTLDASADLRELGQTSVAVVSAGVKSILDIPRTLEYLETQGVPVITYGSEWFPAFFSASSGIKSPCSLYSTQEIAKVLFQKQRLGLKNGCLISVPNNNPAEGEIIEKAIQQALKQAGEQGIKGAKTTPFLLKRVNELTKGKSLASNIALVLNNAQIGSKIAVDLAKLKQESRKNYPLTKQKLAGSQQSCGKVGPCKGSCKGGKQAVKTPSDSTILFKKQQNEKELKTKGKVIIIGASAVDTEYRPMKGEKFQLYKSCKGYSTRRIGGISRNIAEVCARLSTPTTLITPLGNDQYSKLIEQSSTRLGINLKKIHSPQYPTASYLTVMDDQNDEMIGISDMEINNQLTFDNIYNTFFKEQINSNTFDPYNDIVIIDANVNNDEKCMDDLRKLFGFLNEKGYFVIYQCKGKKTSKISDPEMLKYVSLLRMNKNQHEELFKVLAKRGNNVEDHKQDKYLASLIGKDKKVHRIEETNNIRSLITNKCSDIKLLLKDGQVEMVPVKKCPKVVKTTGAGDTLTGTIVSMLLRGKTVQQSLVYATAASRQSLQTQNAESVICDKLSLQRIEEILKSEL